MIIKKMMLLVTAIALSSGVSLASIKGTNGAAASNNGEDVKITKKIKIKKTSDFSKELSKAREYYFSNNLDAAEKYVDAILNVSSDNMRANELKNKILLLREKIIFLKRSLTSDYLIELKRTVKDGNYYEGFLFLKKIKNLLPSEDINTSYVRLSAERDLIESTIENSRDRRVFRDSIEYFKDEEFIKASKLIYKLYTKYPKFVDFVGMSRYYTVQEENVKRVNMYYKEALKNIKNHRYGKAKDYVELGYSLQPENIKVRTLMEQINMEIM